MFASMFDGLITPKKFLIAEQTDEFNEVHTAEPLGYIHVCERKDDISNEKCATVTLLAVSEIARGKGIGKLLLQAAEGWAQRQGYRLLHLEVFANNSNAQGFYKSLGF